jgi:hypothetical protein
MGKLVRDKIPDMIRASGRTPHVRTLSTAEYRTALLDKLCEEVAELSAAATVSPSPARSSSPRPLPQWRISRSSALTSLIRADVIEETADDSVTATENPGREKMMLRYYAVIAVTTGGLLVGAADQPHTTAAASENESGPSVTAPLAPGTGDRALPARGNGEVPRTSRDS